jgi:serine/threonine protein kinase/lipopolysaccharide biosynthesis regulator YciM
MRCPSCNTFNPDDSQYCSKCGFSFCENNDTLTHTPSSPPPREDTLFFSPGDSFGPRYKIIEEVGRGGMGRVYKAEDKELGITVALKMIHPEYSARTHIIKRFKKETLLARSISHENVIRIYDLGEVDKIKFISMDYIKGQSLKELILTSGRLSVETAISITKQICKALIVAHQKGVIHRDLKPQNILVDSSGKVYVTDFGVAKSVEVMEDSAPGIIIGTIQYISPEQAKGEKADPRSDLYSLGIILYEMLTGEKPFKAETYTGYIQKHIHEKPKLPSKINPNIPAYLEKIILKCLEKEKNSRYQEAQEIITDLEEQTVETKPLLSRIKISFHIQTKKLTNAVYVGLLIILLAAITFLWITRKTSQVPVPPDIQKKSVAVLYFENNTGNKDFNYLRRSLQELLIVDLAQSKFFTVTPHIQLVQIIKDMNLLEEIPHSTETLNKIALDRNVDAFIMGSFAGSDEELLISVNIIESKTHNLIGTEKVKSKGRGRLDAAVDELTKKIKSQFRLTSNEIASDVDKKIGDITTHSPEALKYYIEGEKYFADGKFRESINVLQKALDIDPEFAMALLRIADNYGYHGYINEATKYRQKALTLLHRVSDRERYLIQGPSIESLKERIKNYRKLLRLYPDEEKGYLNIGSIYRYLEEWDRSIEWMKGALTTNNKSQLAYKNLAILYMAQGLYEEAKNLLLENKHAFSLPSYHRYMAHIHLFQGQSDLALNEARSVLSIEPDNYFNIELLGNLHHLRGELAEAQGAYLKLIEMNEPVSQSLGRFWLAHLCLLKGQFTKCEDEITQGIAHSREHDLKEYEVLFRVFLTYLNLRKELFERALDSSNKAIEAASEGGFTNDQKLALHLQGLSYVGMHKLDEAKKSARQLKRLIKKTENEKHIRHYYHLKGNIALKEGSTSKALDYFEKAVNLLPRQRFKMDPHAFYIDALVAAYMAAEDTESSLHYSEKTVSLSTGRLQWGDIYAKSFYIQGKIYQKRGMVEEAAHMYDRFLKLWRDADSDLSEVEDAQKQLEALGKAQQQ